MESRLRVQGHPIQPMLVTFPFGLFVSAAVLDLADVAGGPAFLGEVGYWTAVAALVAAALAAVAGLVDLWDARADRTRRTAVTVNLVNAAMAALFLLTCLMRADAPERGATGVELATELLALAVGSVGVWLGARLVRQFDRGRASEQAGLERLADLPASTVEIIRPPA
ncbi:DUF2231 domain-containing protein [Micromonospora sp. DR5-3]|uniref:DUF2231 domain-containing protein n=1 Tax=unclassified Micromonospora TaxID=2617518 RepID=UPI0011D601EE|nr:MULTISPECIES: DUF2231 domain-containing protein [unclassified Micromonospora]MCW3818063.1 DUF2231 domain-containing protein [Micromonospora sp. DR5-3]TYC22329.1 DUF2231 domain-containing protein [Micromonospora sp. MP36]